MLLCFIANALPLCLTGLNDVIIWIICFNLKANHNHSLNWYPSGNRNTRMQWIPTEIPTLVLAVCKLDHFLFSLFDYCFVFCLPKSLSQFWFLFSQCSQYTFCDKSFHLVASWWILPYCLVCFHVLNEGLENCSISV